MSLKIDILCSDGSPIGVCPQCLWGDNFRTGVGGAEYALLTLCEEWTKAGYDLRLYNSPHGCTDKIDQRPVETFSPSDDRDVLIVFRSPNAQVISAKGMKVWFSCDQYTCGSFQDFAPIVDKIVCISPFHQKYFREIYGIENTISIDLPIRINEIPQEVKIPGRFIFTSVPDRGLPNLWRMYPKIKRKLPDASLVITSDYRLWGVDARNGQHRAQWSSLVGKDFYFRGALPRTEYLVELAKAEVMLYPGNYDELFCISVAEAQCAGVYTVTSDYGALETTNMGLVLPNDPNNPDADHIYIQNILDLMIDSSSFSVFRQEVMAKAKVRFSIENIMKQWNEKVFK